MGVVGLNVVGNKSLITLTTDVNLYQVSDYDPRTGANLTVALRPFEPKVLIATNRNTAAAALVQLFDVDFTNAQTSTGTPEFEFQLQAGETRVFDEEDLQGIRFYFDVDVIASIITLWMAIRGHEID